MRRPVSGGEWHDKKTDAPSAGAAARDRTLAAAVLLACAAASLAVSEKAEATFPGKNGRIAYSAWDVGTAEAIYTINPGGGAKTKVTSGYQPSYSPDGRRIAYTTLPVFSAFFGGDTHEVYTIKVDGSGKT